MAAAAADYKKGGAAGAAGCVEGLRRFAQGATALRAEGGGIALSGDEYKVSLRDLLSVSYGLIGILVISRYAAPPYPAAPDFLHGKACHTILRSLCSLTNRVPLPPHPGDRINRSMLSCRDMAPLLSTHSAPSKRGKGGGASHQRGKTPKWNLKYMTRCFFLHISRFPLRWQRNWICKRAKRPENPVTCFPPGRIPAKRERVYGVKCRFDTLSFP